jgi:glycosyltransferase involved in cell wall biosynthesis
MRVLVVSTLYPNRVQPVHALFVEQRIRAMAKRFPVRVLAPVPTFPLAGRLPRYAYRRGIPESDERHGILIEYPRFLSVPRWLKPLDGPFLLRALARCARRVAGEFPFDRIDAHLAYPDGWAAVQLGRRLGLPVSVTLRGHDLNDLPRYPVRGRQVAWTLENADAVFAVADALRDAAIALGADPMRTRTVANGVDGERFRPRSCGEARRALGIDPNARWILTVGHLVERKGFHHLVRALPHVAARHPDVKLAIVGGPGEEGDFRTGIRRAIEETGMGERVILPGVADGDVLPRWYAAADVFCLASAKEGRPNVVLEALASGLPVVATRVWGTPELLSDRAYGILVDSTAEEVLAGALTEALGRAWDREGIARYGRQFRWEGTAEAIETVLAGLGSRRAFA